MLKSTLANGANFCERNITFPGNNLPGHFHSTVRDIVKQDLLEIAEKYSIKGARGIIEATVHTTHDFKSWAEKFYFPKEVAEKIMSQFQLFEEVERKHRKLRR